MESLKEAKHKAVQDGEVREGDSVDDLGLGWELDLGIRGESKTSKRAEAVYRKTSKIKQILYAYPWFQNTDNRQACSEATSLF